MDIQNFKQRLQEVKKQLDNKEIDEIPLDARPKMLDFDFDKDSYIIVSYSRKDFVEVYLFLAHLYNEGYRFWYDNGMKGAEKWLEEYKSKFENPNCLGTITFFSDNYISDSTKEELEIIYNENGYAKKNVMISLIPFEYIESEKILKQAILNDRITIENAAAIKPVLTELIAEEKDKTIHRYNVEVDIRFLAEKIDKDFDIRYDSIIDSDNKNCAIKDKKTKNLNDFAIRDGELLKYVGNDSEVVVPDGVCSIGDRAFEGCTFISHITIPNGVTAIGSRAFEKCTSLRSVTIPNDIKSIGSAAFADCMSLNKVTIPSGVSIIEPSTFRGCVSLVEIAIPNSVIKIGVSAFKGCSLLTKMSIPNGVTRIGVNTFKGCESLTSIAIPSGVTSIGKGAFGGCTSLTSIAIPNSVTDIEKGAFGGCISLTNVTIPNSVINMGSRVFSNCARLADIVIPDGITMIGRELFCNCRSLASVNIPSEVKVIAREAFAFCSSLEQITYSETKEKWILIEKHKNWHNGIKSVKCTDGTIEL